MIFGTRKEKNSKYIIHIFYEYSDALEYSKSLTDSDSLIRRNFHSL